MGDFLEILLGTEGRARLIKFFLLNTASKTTSEELRERLKLDKRTIKKELEVLEKAEIIKKRKAQSKFYYFVSKECIFYPELKKVVSKCTVFPQIKSLEKIPKTGHVKLILVTGIFANNPKTRADILIVGDGVNKNRLKEVIKDIEAEIGKELRYAVFTDEEFGYRLNMFDKFIKEFFEGPHRIIFNKIKDKDLPENKEEK